MMPAGSEPAMRTVFRRVLTPALSRSAPHSEQRPWVRVVSSYPHDPQPACRGVPGGGMTARQTALQASPMVSRNTAIQAKPAMANPAIMGSSLCRPAL